MRRHPDVRLMPSGLRLADEAIGRHFADVDGRLAALTAAERRQLAGLLSKLLGSARTL